MGYSNCIGIIISRKKVDTIFKGNWFCLLHRLLLVTSLCGTVIHACIQLISLFCWLSIRFGCCNDLLLLQSSEANRDINQMVADLVIVLGNSCQPSTNRCVPSDQPLRIPNHISEMKVFFTISLLILSNTFMTFAWYGHLKFKEMSWSQNLGLASIILISWGIALFEYILQVPANRIGFKEYGGPFSLVELKVIQEVVTLTVFVVFSLLVFKNETFRWNHAVGFLFLVLAVYFIFKK
jgi:uncharacterized protein